MSKKNKKHKKIKRDLSGTGFVMPKFGEPNLVLDTCPQAWKDWANKHTDMAMNDLIYRTTEAQAREDWARVPPTAEEIEIKKQIAADLMDGTLPRPKRGRPKNVTPEHTLEVVRAAIRQQPSLITNPFIERFCIDNLGLIVDLHKEGKIK